MRRLCRSVCIAAALGLPVWALAGTEPWVHAPSQREPAAPGGSGACSAPSAFTLPDAKYPIYFASGEFYTSATDLEIKGRGMNFTWSRVYGSQTGPNSAQGNGWDYAYNIRVVPEGDALVVSNGWGRSTAYTLQGDGSYAASGYFRRLSFDTERAAYTLKFPDAGLWNFRRIDGSPASGKIESIVDRNGNRLAFAYDAQGRLATITDTLGRAITVGYTAAGMIQTVTDPEGRQVRYTYSASGNLLTARSPVVTGTPHGNNFPSGRTVSYTYSSGFAQPALNNNLLTIRDARGAAIVTNTYHATTTPTDVNFDRITRFVQDTPDILDVVYVPLAGGGVKAILNDPVGNVKEFTYNAAGEGIVFDEFTGRADPALPTTETTNRPTGALRNSDPEVFRTVYEYQNSDFLLTRVVRPNLDEELFAYDTLNTSRRSQGNLLEHQRLAGPLGGDQFQLTDVYEYLPGQGGCCGANFVTRHINPRGFETVHAYDPAGNRVSTTHPDGGVESWAYNAYGQMVKHVFPDNAGCRRVDTYEYFAAGPATGYLQREVVDASDPAACAGSHLNLTTTYQRDARGNVTSRTDPRGQTELSEYNQLNELVRTLSAPAAGGQRIESLYYYEANGNVARADVENRDETGARPAANTHFSVITDYGILNETLRVAREFGTANLDGSVMTTNAIPIALRGEFAVNEFAYDGNHNRVLERYGEAVRGTQRGNTMTLAYDERDRTFRSTRAFEEPGQSTTQYDYDGNGNTIRTIEGLEEEPHQTVSEYDGFGRLIRSTDPLGNVSEFHYDENGNLGGLARQDPPTPNPFGVRLSGQLLDVPGSEGNVRLSEVTYAYDARDRRTREDVRHFDAQSQEPIGDGQATTLTTYSAASMVLAVQDDNGGTRAYGYDAALRATVVSDSIGGSTTYVLDANGNATSMVVREFVAIGATFQNFTTTRAFDNLNREVSSTDSSGNTRLAAFDSRGNMVRETDARGVVTRRTFDGLGRLTATSIDMNANGVFTDAADIITTQAWDRSSRLIGQTDDAGNTTTYQFDPLDHVTRVGYADGTSDLFVFDVHGDRVEATDPNGTVVRTTFDGLHRPLTRTVTRGPGVLGTTLESFAYDGAGRLVRGQDDDSLVTRGSASTSGYDSLSNILRESQQVLPGGPVRTVVCTYDGVGNMLSCVYPGGTRVARTYDSAGRLSAIVDGETAAQIASYSYAGPSRVHHIVRGNGTRTVFTYDGIDAQPNPSGDFGVRRVVQTRHTLISSGAVLDDRSYLWDRESSKTRRRDLRDSGQQLRHEYSYDAGGRMERAVVFDAAENPVDDEQYTLDGVGNRSEVSGGDSPGTYTMNAAFPDPADRQSNQYTTTPFDSRVYDASGNLAVYRAPCPADFNFDEQVDFFDYLDFAAVFDIGDLAADFNHDAQVDFFDYLDFVAAFDADCEPARFVFYDFQHRMVEHQAETVTRHAYDVLGRRIEKVLDATGSPSRTRFYYCGWQEIEEQNGQTGATLATFVYGPYIDELVRMVRSGQAYYAHLDDLHNVMALSNSAGAVVERYNYGGFGRPEFFSAGGTRLEASAVGNPVLFTGRRYDPETGWFYYRTRFLDPRAGRFTSIDSIGVWGDGANLGNGQAYVANSPWSALDPMGEGIYCPGYPNKCFDCPYCPSAPPCGEGFGFPCRIGAAFSAASFTSSSKPPTRPGGPRPGGPGPTNPGNPFPEPHFPPGAGLTIAPGGAMCDLNPWLPGCPCGGVNPPPSCFGMGGDFGGGALLNAGVSLSREGGPAAAGRNYNDARSRDGYPAAMRNYNDARSRDGYPSVMPGPDPGPMFSWWSDWREKRECKREGHYYMDGTCYMKPPPGWIYAQ